MIEFLKTYGFTIPCFIELIALILLLIVKKKKPSIVLETMLSILADLPRFINSVEQLGCKGDKKKELVLSMVLAEFEKRIHRFSTSEEKLFMEQYYDDAIEGILSTPQKHADK